MAKRAQKRWQTVFGTWVNHYTVPRLAQQLAARGEPATPTAIYHWLAGDCLPRPGRALAIVELSGGQVSLADVYAHSAQVRAGGPARP